MKNIIDILMLVFVVILIGNMIWQVIHAKGTWFERILAAGRDSLTIVWSRLVAIAGSLIGILAWVADIVGAPQVSAVIQSYLDAKTIAVMMIVIAVITEISRRRTLPSPAIGKVT